MAMTVRNYMEMPLVELIQQPDFDSEELAYVARIVNTPVSELLQEERTAWAFQPYLPPRSQESSGETHPQFLRASE